MRHGRKSRAKTFHGFAEHLLVDWDSTVTREVVVRLANEPEPFQQQLRATLSTQCGRAFRRKRTAVEHAIAHQ